jgi:cbb3-type cytochrome oxidase subunit 3
VRVLTSSVLVMEAIVLGLAIPVVLVVGEHPAWVGWLLAGLALACLLLPAAVGRRWFEPAGWVLQGTVLACGVFEGMLFVLGGIFLLLWWAALRFGRKGDAARAALDAAAEQRSSGR